MGVECVPRAILCICVHFCLFSSTERLLTILSCMVSTLIVSYCGRVGRVWR